MELLEIFDLDGNYLRTEERSKYYSSIKKEHETTGKITTQVKQVKIILNNSKGEIYIQKRSATREENPGLYDKSVAGHVPKGEDWDSAAIRECEEELGIKAIISNTQENIQNTKDQAIIRKIATLNAFKSRRKTRQGTTFIQPVITTIYSGLYDGKTRIQKSELSEVTLISRKDLEKDIKNNPEKYTDDIDRIMHIIDTKEKGIKPDRHSA